MTDLKKLRIGIVGCGKIADGHAEVVQHLEGAELVAVCDREPLLAEQLAVRYGVPGWYGDLGQMLERERLDVVHITTPPGVHLALTRQCVAAGAHVFLEKPLALTAPESQALIDAVVSGGRQMSINYWPNFDPPAMEFKAMLAQGVIGEPVHVEAFIGYDLSGAYGQALMGDAGHWVHRLPGKLFQN
ncbi:MAG: gfo/Idh/MocA family oxidoreductase, partial [Edaphobacter sp.]|nr:gfo/Idh/MocA family oxidoreductase [Edaphobacter sp.]